MKLIILTSSIFYLLGLKLTHQVELEQPFATDSVIITAPVEQIEIPEPEAAPKEEAPVIDDKPDTIQSSRSNSIIAPWFPMIEELDPA
ncbi:hypothetical protein [Sunxiuqinia dokdonensis]|uniref:Uncharacterized protein n=1 Tax=Sunxiuqinia dokdonensis TaxID=1409788 RepID=A0A0L8V9I6_9BACT|nr:hypothetical protein [Sunxiuqinia dokdonensis]KOH45099.1 hypothetical protein NC99_19610 [Sunxiuqinia dokdonensis]